MIDFYYWPTPNGWKVAIMLEELGVPYRTIPVNIGKGEQFKPEFLAISPNNACRRSSTTTRRRPTQCIRCRCSSPAPSSGTSPKHGCFLPADARGRRRCRSGCSWQTGNQGPMAGQLSHFVNYAPGGRSAHGYSHDRYADEYDRCLAVLERRLAGRTWLAGEDYSIADMICWPWVLIAKPLGGSLEPYPNVTRWRTAVKDRPAVQRGVDLGKEFRRTAPPTEAERKMLFGQRGSVET